MKNQFIGRGMLIALFLVFFAPLILAMWLFYGPNTWLTSNTQNHGTLIQPPRPLHEFILSNQNGDTWSQEDFLGKWTLLYLGDEHCDLYCEADLFKMRQVRLTLGHDSQRVQRKYLGIDKQQNKRAINTIFERYPHLQVGWFASNKISSVLPQLNDMQTHQILLIDPLGNLMMFYTKDATAKGIKKDLKRLLKVSKVG